MSHEDDLRPGARWSAYTAARERFLARVRPESMRHRPPSACPDAPPAEWAPPPSADGPAGPGPPADPGPPAA